jgi:ferritin-like metal-binding protein YciE
MEMRELLMNKVQALYDIESVLIDSMPKMIEAATDRKLKVLIDDHLKETKEQSRRLEEVFKLLDAKPEKLESDAIRGLVKDAEWVMENIEDSDLLDLGIIGAASYVEHYEMAGYNMAIMLAEKLEENDAADLLNMTFTEEEAADGKLNDLAQAIAEKSG